MTEAAPSPPDGSAGEGSMESLHSEEGAAPNLNKIAKFYAKYSIQCTELERLVVIIYSYSVYALR